MSQIVKTHLFGEMDLNLEDSLNKIYKEAFRIAECCGYMVESKENTILLFGSDYEKAKIYFENNKVTTVTRSLDDGKNWETLDFKEKLFSVSLTTLKQYNRKIKYGTEKTLPFCQGEAIKTVIKKYKIPVKRWGYHFDLIGVETKKQFMIWRDQGHQLEFLGLINKDGSKPE